MSSNGLVERDDFWRFVDREYRDVKIEGFGTIRIRSLSDGEERQLADKAFDDAGKLVNARYAFAHRAIAQLVDSDNQPLFGDIDTERLVSMDYRVSRKIMQAMRAFSDGAAGATTIDNEKKS